MTSSKDQAGAVFNDTNEYYPEQVSGRDDYYNHGIYPAGWSHWGMGMGNPLLISPIYNKDCTLRFKHNRVKAHHFGLSGSPATIRCRRPPLQRLYTLVASVDESW